MSRLCLFHTIKGRLRSGFETGPRRQFKLRLQMLFGVMNLDAEMCVNKCGARLSFLENGFVPPGAGEGSRASTHSGCRCFLNKIDSIRHLL